MSLSTFTVIPSMTTTVTTGDVVIHFQKYPGKTGGAGIANVPFVFKVNGNPVPTTQTVTQSDGKIVLHGVNPTNVNELLILGTTYRLLLITTVEPMSTSDVHGLQRRLSILGYELGNIDGSNGPKTDYAILCFQADKNLDPNGLVTNLAGLTADAGV